jgi:hypothetical protein
LGFKALTVLVFRGYLIIKKIKIFLQKNLEGNKNSPTFALPSKQGVGKAESATTKSSSKNNQDVGVKAGGIASPPSTN